MARFVGVENVERARDYLEQIDPELHRYIVDFVYGEVYEGQVLEPKTRALCTVAMLGVLGQQLQLAVYVRAAHRQGASEEELREVLRQVAVYAGFPNAWNALATMKAAHAALEQKDKAARRQRAPQMAIAEGGVPEAAEFEPCVTTVLGNCE
jgi:4-carboxymuconolactone decarboxylase